MQAGKEQVCHIDAVSLHARQGIAADRPSLWPRYIANTMACGFDQAAVGMPS